jgi:hypothetical protein
MSFSPYEKFRMVMAGARPGRFESSVNRFKSLQELSGDASRSSTLDQVTPEMDPLADKGVKEKLIQHSIDARRERFQTLKRLRRLSLTDFNMIGGVAPTGSMSGAGGADGNRPTSFAGRS